MAAGSILGRLSRVDTDTECSDLECMSVLPALARTSDNPPS